MIRSAVARLANRLSRGRLWWCAHCGAYAHGNDLHAFEVDGGGSCNRCVADGHADDCDKCFYARRPGGDWPSRHVWLVRLLAALANLAGGLSTCYACGDLGDLRSDFHLDGDPERRQVCAGCELEMFDGQHGGGDGCPQCRGRGGK